MGQGGKENQHYVDKKKDETVKGPHNRMPYFLMKHLQTRTDS